MLSFALVAYLNARLNWAHIETPAGTSMNYRTSLSVFRLQSDV